MSWVAGGTQKRTACGTDNVYREQIHL